MNSSQKPNTGIKRTFIGFRRLPHELIILILVIFALTFSSAGAQVLPNTPNKTPAELLAIMQVATQSVDHSFGSASQSFAPNRSSADIPICGITHLVRCIKDLTEDDRGIFTSPLRLKARDAYWLMPLGAATGLAFAYDTDAEAAAGYGKARENTSNTIADFGSFYATGAEGAAIYFTGVARHNPKLAETGRLGAEAVIDSGTVTLATKLLANRERPLEGDHQGSFWTNGTGTWHWDSSFPSDHAADTMALARVIAGEYPRWYIEVPAYGFAETISISRILGNAHFPSDVIVGQAIGFLTGTYVLNHRSLYRGEKRSLTTRILESTVPMISQPTHGIGASVEIPIGR